LAFSIRDLTFFRLASGTSTPTQSPLIRTPSNSKWLWIWVTAIKSPLKSLPSK